MADLNKDQLNPESFIIDYEELLKTINTNPQIKLRVGKDDPIMLMAPIYNIVLKQMTRIVIAHQSVLQKTLEDESLKYATQVSETTRKLGTMLESETLGRLNVSFEKVNENIAKSDNNFKLELKALQKSTSICTVIFVISAIVHIAVMLMTK